MIKQICLAALLTILNYVISQTTTSTETTTETIGQPKITLRCDPDKKGSYKIGETVYLCLHLLPQKKRMAFQVTVDSYEILTVSGIYLFTKKDTANTNSGFVVQLGDSFTPYESNYHNLTSKSVFSMMNIVIKMDKGELTGIAWDNYCWDCAFNLTQCITTTDIKGFTNTTHIYSESVSQLIDDNNRIVQMTHAMKKTVIVFYVILKYMLLGLELT